MAKKHLQEIYGEDDSEIEDTDMTNALNRRISELKEKWGSDWVNHIGDGDGSGEGVE